MSVLQIVLISLFVYLGSIGSIVGNTFGWYNLGRPLVASFVVGLIMGDVNNAMVIGIPLQIMYMGNVTPGGAVAWDLSYATYIGTAAALVLGEGMGATELIGVAVVFAGVGGLVGQLMWNISYALNLPLNRIAQKYADEAAVDKMHIPNLILGQLIGFACRFIPAFLLLSSLTMASSSMDIAAIIPSWLTTLLSVFGGMMAALGMGIILSFLIQEKYQFAIYLFGFILVTYFELNTMAVAVIAILVSVVYYTIVDKQMKKETL